MPPSARIPSAASKMPAHAVAWPYAPSPPRTALSQGWAKRYDRMRFTAHGLPALVNFFLLSLHVLGVGFSPNSSFDARLLALYLGLASLTLLLRACVRRGRDLGLSGATSTGAMLLALCFGPAVFALALGLSLAPERRDAYRFGAPPPPASRTLAFTAAAMLSWPWVVLTLAERMQWV